MIRTKDLYFEQLTAGQPDCDPVDDAPTLWDYRREWEEYEAAQAAADAPDLTPDDDDIPL